MQARGKAPNFFGLLLIGHGVNRESATAALDGGFQGFHHACLFGARDTEAIGHHIEHAAWASGRGHFALGMGAGEAAGAQPLLHFFGRGARRQLHRKGQHQARVAGRRAAL